MSYQDKLQEKRQAALAKIEAKKKEAGEQREAEKETKALTNPNFSMHNLKRAVISYDQVQYYLPMHSYKLSWSTLIHTHKNEKGWTSHVLCTDLWDEPCPWCRKEGYEFQPREIKASIFYVVNTVGEKRSFEKEENGEKKTITYFLNPAQVVEIGVSGTANDVVRTFESWDKQKAFMGKVWQVLLKKGVAKQGKDGRVRYTGGGFELPEALLPEELAERIGKEGFEPNLPEYAQKWADTIAEVYKTKGEDEAKREVIRYMLPCFDNGAEVAALMGLELPAKPERNTNKGIFN